MKRCSVFMNPSSWEELKLCVHPYFNPILPFLDIFYTDIRFLLLTQSPTPELAERSGKNVVDTMSSLIRSNRVRRWDQEGKPGAEAQYEQHRQAELKRRLEQGWLPTQVESPYVSRREPLVTDRDAHDPLLKRRAQERR